MNKDKYKLSAEDQKLDEEYSFKLLVDVIVANKMANKLPMNPIADLSEARSELAKVERDQGQIEAIVDSTINKVYYDENKQNYLDIASELVNKLANKHALFDSNKRTALNTGVKVLENGLDIKIDLEENTSKYMNFMVDVVDNWKTLSSEDEQIKKINSFLDKEVERSSKTNNSSSSNNDLEPE